MHLQKMLSTVAMALSLAPIVSSQCIKIGGSLTEYTKGDRPAISNFYLEDKTPGRTGCDFRGDTRYYIPETSKGRGFDGLCNGGSGNIFLSLDGKNVKYYHTNGTQEIRLINFVVTEPVNKETGEKRRFFGGNNGKC